MEPDKSGKLVYADAGLSKGFTGYFHKAILQQLNISNENAFFPSEEMLNIAKERQTYFNEPRDLRGELFNPNLNESYEMETAVFQLISGLLTYKDRWGPGEIHSWIRSTTYL